MAKRTEEQKARLRAAARHPVRWLRGEGLPAETVRPWEQAAQIVPGVFNGLVEAFTNKRDWLWQNVFYMGLGPQAVISTVSAVWDGVNDPLIGSYMDYKNYPARVNRLFMRAASVACKLMPLLTVFDWGLSTWQRVALAIVANCVADLFGTASGVAGAKVFARITPHSAQRAGLIAMARLGEMIKENVAAAGWPLLGLRDILGISPYQMYVWWTVIFSVPAMLADMAPSFVLQRVPDPAPPQKTMRLKGVLLELRDSFAVMRYNRFFLVNTAARFFAVFTPGVAAINFFRFGGVNETVERAFPAWKEKGNPELLYSIHNFATGAPGSLLQPFALRAIKRAGGPRGMMLLFSASNAALYLLCYLIGVKTVPGFLFTWGAHLVSNIVSKWESVACGIADYEMLDYVEWKTGRRSEGVKTAVDGLINKVVLNNIDTVVGSLALSRAGFDPKLETRQPPRYVKWATVFYFLSPVLDNLFYLVARLFYKYPAGLRDRVEAELIERRKLAAQTQEAQPAGA